LMDLYVSRTSPKQQDVVSGEPSVCMGGLMWASLAFRRLQGYYSHPVLKSVTVIGRSPANMNIPAPEIGTLQNSTET
jgi:hypothetical protein